MPRSLLSITELTKKDILAVFERAAELSKSTYIEPATVNTSISGGLLFFEPSTRTQHGFDTASWRLGVKTLLLNETKLTSSMSSAESISDTIRTMNPYVSYFCVRHPDENVFDQIMPYTEHPVINCGNGYQEHPTQALIDAYAIWHKFGKLDGITITMIGELKYARAVHSLLLLLANFTNITIKELSPAELTVQDDYRVQFEKNKNTYVKSKKVEWGHEQVVYVTGFPPNNPSGSFDQSLRDRYKITKQIATQLTSDCIILNALPRIDEIDTDVDDLPQAYYFKQNELGFYVRMAIIEQFCL